MTYLVNFIRQSPLRIQETMGEVRGKNSDLDLPNLVFLVNRVTACPEIREGARFPGLLKRNSRPGHNVSKLTSVCSVKKSSNSPFPFLNEKAEHITISLYHFLVI